MNSFSRIIKASRFPLIVLVVIIHTIGSERINLSSPRIDNQYFYYFVSEMISHNYAFISVCLFFLFAGYLFFYNIDEFSWNWCIVKWKKRFFSIFIPFISWNLIFVLAVYIKSILPFGSGSNDHLWLLSTKQISYWFTAPVNYPLWFLQDLMKLILLVPILWFYFKATKVFGILLLSLMYFSTWSPAFLDMRALFFFSTGAYLAIQKIDVMRTICRFKTAGHILAVITLLAATIQNTSPYHDSFFLRLFFPFGIISFLNIVNCLPTRVFNFTSKLDSSSFFIFATHTILIINIAKGLCFSLFNESHDYMPLSYIFVPAITVAICLFLFWLFKNTLPRTTSILCGGR